MPDFTLHPRPVFRATAADQDHAVAIAGRLRAAGRKATPTAILRHALQVAAGAAVAPSRPHIIQP